MVFKMAKLTYIYDNGERRSLEVAAGANVMLTAIENDIPGIVAECGGAAMCATCHVYVDESSLKLVPPRSVVEEEMLNSTASARLPNSRLSCQLVIPENIDEFVVHIPPSQV